MTVHIFRRKQVVLFAFVIFVSSIPSIVSAIELGLGTGLQASSEFDKAISPYLGLRVEHTSEQLDFVADVELKRDGKYPSPEPQASGAYFVMREAGLKLTWDDLSLEGGRHDPFDAFPSPYSLFLSSAQHNPLTVRLAYDGGPFFYESRWTGLNTNSDIFKVDYDIKNSSSTIGTLTLPLDRGSNFKTYGIRFFEHFRFAYQEASTYTGRYFDAEFFLNPLPGYFVQYVNISDGTPWKQAKPWSKLDNANYIMGFLLDYQDESRWLGLQFLLDDINLNRIIAPDSFQNPDKLGLSLGWRETFDWGIFGVYGALVTKYTFEPIGVVPEDRYGYTYWPATKYPQNPGLVDSAWSIIASEDNNIGYMNGENTLAFSTDWRHTIDDVDLYCWLEYRIAGAQSPANPWHGYTAWAEGGSGPRWLGEDRLEHRIRVKLNADYQYNEWSFWAQLDTGFVVNELELVSSNDEDLTDSQDDRHEAGFMSIWIPGSTSRLFATFFAGIRYTWDLDKAAD